MEVCPYFRWGEDEAREEIHKICRIRNSWEAKAREMKLHRNEIEEVRTAFERGFS